MYPWDIQWQVRNMCLLPEASRLKHIVQTQPFRCWSCVLPRLPQDPPRFRVKSRVLAAGSLQDKGPPCGTVWKRNWPLSLAAELKALSASAEASLVSTSWELLWTLPRGGPLPAPSTAPGRPSSVLSAHRKPGDFGLAGSTSSPYRLPRAQTASGFWAAIKVLLSTT